VVSDVPVDDETLVVISIISRPADAQSFRCALRGRVCVRVVSVCVVLKNKLTRGGSKPTFMFSTNGGNRENTRKKKVTERSKHGHKTM
jgi:hypothetical protein